MQSSVKDDMRYDDPVLIGGLPRSGNTWMQFALNRHSHLQIAGNLPARLVPGDFMAFADRLRRAGRIASEGNANLNYECPHFAGALPGHTNKMFADFVRRWVLAEPQTKPRWGFKALYGEFYFWRRLWPELRVVFCLRHPRAMINSHKNNLNSTRQPSAILQRWVSAAREACEQPRRFFPWPTDQLALLSQTRREEKMLELLNWLREPAEPEVLAYARAFPVVHKLKADHERKYSIEDKHWYDLLDSTQGAKHFVRKFGYTLEGI
jgi:hypothetical protein